MRPQRSMEFGKQKKVHKLNDKDKATFYSPSEVWSLLAPSSKKREEREFVVDSGASMHMLIKKVLGSEERETLRRSRNPTTVVNGEVQTNEIAQENVYDLDLFVTVQILDDTPAEDRSQEETGKWQKVFSSSKKGHSYILLAF